MQILLSSVYNGLLLLLKKENKRTNGIHLELGQNNRKICGEVTTHIFYCISMLEFGAINTSKKSAAKNDSGFLSYQPTMTMLNACHLRPISRFQNIADVQVDVSSVYPYE